MIGTDIHSWIDLFSNHRSAECLSRIYVVNQNHTSLDFFFSIMNNSSGASSFSVKVHISSQCKTFFLQKHLCSKTKLTWFIQIPCRRICCHVFVIQRPFQQRISSIHDYVCYSYVAVTRFAKILPEIII